MAEPHDARGAGREPAPGVTSAGPSSALFREEALSHHFRAGWEGDVLRLPPAWTRWTYPLLLVLTAAAAVFLTTGSVRQYAGGPAVVKIEGVTDVIAPAAGIVQSLAVRTGDAVAAGTVVAAVGTHGTRHELTSPIEGIVHAIRASPGRAVAAGEPVLSVAPSPARFEVVALLPGTTLPSLRSGQRLSVVLDAAPRSPLEATLATVPRQVVGPAEARRALPPAVADVPSIEGPVVIATAEIPVEAALGRPAPQLREGMTGRAEVEVGSERLLFALVPALKATGDR